MKNVINRNCPCRTCENDRHMGCHGSCEGYKAWRLWLDEVNERENARKTAESNANEYLYTNISKFKRLRGQKP